MTTSAERIKSAAIARFAAQGYDAASLAEIAGDVGIKTPSIYAHFQGKQDLFRQLVEYAAERELAYIREELLRPEPVRSAMRRYLYGTIERFGSEPHLLFWLRTLYLPPPKMQEEIGVYDKKFSDSLEEIISSALLHPVFGLKKPVIPHETLTIAFTGVLRAVHAELLYCSDSAAERGLTALWTVFELSVAEK